MEVPVKNIRYERKHPVGESQQVFTVIKAAGDEIRAWRSNADVHAFILQLLRPQSQHLSETDDEANDPSKQVWSYVKSHQSNSSGRSIWGALDPAP